MGITTKEKKINIVIPVYKGETETIACIESVLKHQDNNRHEVIVIEDKSPDPNIVKYLQALAQQRKIVLIQNEENLGFVASVNKGMQYQKDRDVVLLNSDTVVANDWLERIEKAAYSEKNIGTVTPFSNNATICSYPYYNGEGAADLPAGISLEQLDQIFSIANKNETEEIPTAVGFCMFIKKECLEMVGYFDTESFGKGYGEENDFSRRAKKNGWRNIIAADVYVYHAGGISFGDQQNTLKNKALETLLKKHPDYLFSVRQYMKVDPLAKLRDAVDHARISSNPSQKKIVEDEKNQSFPSETEQKTTITAETRLHISHSWGGGIEKWVGDYAKNDEATNFSLETNTTKLAAGYALTLWIHQNGKKQKVSTWELATPINSSSINHGEYREILHGIIDQLNVKTLFISSLIGHSLDALTTGKETLIILHDLYPFCPAFFGFFKKSACEHCDGASLTACQSENELFYFKNRIEPTQWTALRQAYAESIKNNQIKLIAPSTSAWQRWQLLLPAIKDIPCTIIPHGTDLTATDESAHEDIRGNSNRLKAVILGRLATHKGKEIAQQAIPSISQYCDILILGCGTDCADFEKKESITIVQEYETGNLAEIINEFKPDIALLLSIVPETFSYTLSEMSALNIPCIAINTGAFRERIQDQKTGWLIEPTSDALIQQLKTLDSNRQSIRAAKEILKNELPYTTRDMWQRYKQIIQKPNTDMQYNPLIDGAIRFQKNSAVEIKSLLDTNKTLQSELGKYIRAKAEAEEKLMQEIYALRIEMNRLGSQIHDITQSRSWRITQPIRRIARLIRKFIQEGKTGAN